MLPTFNLTGDLLLAEQILAQFGRVGPGDIAIIRSPGNPRKIVAKCVKGVEGDSVTYAVEPKSSDRCETVVV